MIFKIFLITFLLNILNAFDIDKNSNNISLLKEAKLYIDYNNSSFTQIKKANFIDINKEYLSFGYNPKFSIWLKLTLHNKSNYNITKIIEYNNPLTTKVEFYKDNNLFLVDGMFYYNKNRKTLTPYFEAILNPNQTKTFYIKASSNITTLIAKLNLYNKDYFYISQLKKISILALFFGAIIIIIIYNLVIYLSTKDISYLYYVLAFIGILYHHMLYKGVANLIIPNSIVIISIKYSTIIVALPTIFLALFTLSILNIQKNTLSYKLVKGFILFFPIWLIIIHIFNLNHLRSLYTLILEIALFIITLKELFKNNRFAKFLIVGWSIFLSSTIFMYLSSCGIYDIFNIYPYCIEFFLIIEVIVFALALAYKIRVLQNEKIKVKQALISYQNQEKERLKFLVNQKTKHLIKAIKEKTLLLKELKHRVTNSLNTIASFINIEANSTKNKETKNILKRIYNEITAVNKLYNILNVQKSIIKIDANIYFNQIIKEFINSHNITDITINLTCSGIINSKDAIYCGIILNEALENSYKHAFKEKNNNKIISIIFNKKNNIYSFIIKDNGVGFKNILATSKGISLIKDIVLIQFEGVIKIDSTNGTQISIYWKEIDE